MTLIDKINDIAKLIRQGKISHGAQSLYLVILITWNGLKRPETFRLTESQIMAMTKLKTRKSVIKYRKELLALNLIGFTMSKKLYGSQYRVV